NRGFKSALSVLGLFFLLIYGVSLLGFTEPASFFLALIPAAVAFLLMIIAYTERRRMVIWIVIAAICVIPGTWMALFSAYHHHVFFKLDPAVVESIEMRWNDGRRMNFVSPGDIRTLMRALQMGDIKQTEMTPRSETVFLVINRPAGRDYFVEMFREGSGSRAVTAYRLYCNAWSFHFPLGLMASEMTDKVLRSTGTTQAIWPPGY
ncbi:MAG TPA: hypothetical protein PLV45_18565, partial [bacterium]|nr:hypothetical protein [bacterium]